MLSKEELQEFGKIIEKAKKYYTGNIRIGIPLNGTIARLCTAGPEK